MCPRKSPSLLLSLRPSFLRRLRKWDAHSQPALILYSSSQYRGKLKILVFILLVLLQFPCEEELLLDMIIVYTEREQTRTSKNRLRRECAKHSVHYYSRARVLKTTIQTVHHTLGGLVRMWIKQAIPHLYVTNVTFYN